MEMRFECSHCGQHLLVEGGHEGQTFACPKCGKTISPRASTQSIAPVMVEHNPGKEIKTNIKQGAARGGWVCFGIACGFMFIPVPTWFIYGPLLFASFVLSIIAMSQGRIANGIILLLANVLGAPILLFIALAIGIVTWGSMLEKAISPQDRAEKARTLGTKTLLQATATALDAYRLDLGSYPTKEQAGLDALLKKPAYEKEKLGEKWAGPYFPTDTKFEDAWGHKIIYEEVTNGGLDAQSGNSKLSFNLYSVGPDGQLGTEDDIKYLDDENNKAQKTMPQKTKDTEAQSKATYIREHLVLYEFEARYMDSVLDGKVPGVLFKLRNTGDRTLEMVKVTVRFKDATGTVIHDEDFHPISVSDFSFSSDKPLKPGYVWQMESRKFYAAKSVPSEWKEGSADAQITDIRFSKN